MDSILNLPTPITGKRPPYVGLSRLTNRARVLGCGLALFCLVGVTPAWALTTTVCTWTGAVNGSWSNAGNWDRLPVGGEDLVFNGSANASTTNDLPADTSFNNITFNAGAAAFTLAGNRITLTGSITSNSTNVQTISLPMILTAAHGVNAASGAISLSGILSGTGGLIKSGPNALTLSGANTHTGSIIHNAGTLNINSTTALGAASSGLTIAAGTTINNSTGAAITVANANPLTISGSFTFTGTNNLTFGAGAVTLSNSTMTISANTLAIPGVIGGAATLTKAGGGTLSLTNTANTYTGLTTISAGILKVANLANAGSACSLGTNGTIALGSGTSTGTLYYTGTGTVSTNRVINLAGTTGGGMIEEAGASGTLTFTAACTATGAGSKTLTLKGSTSAIGVFAGAIVDNSTTNKTLLAKSGTGVWRLSGACTYTGTTAITGGTLQLGNGGLTGALSPSSAIAVTSPGILQFNRTNTVTQGTDFASVIAGTGALIQAGSGTLALNGANTYTGKSSIKAGTISAGSLANVGAGASALGAPTTVANGTIEIGSTTVAGTLLFTAAVTSDRLVNLAGTTGGATITHHSSGTCTLGGVTATGSGIKTLTLNGNTGGAGIISGVIPNSASATAVTKSGTGVWTLGGVNTYTGATTVNGGTLLVNGSTASGSAVAVNNSATLGGSGTANGVITPASGGAVAPGAAAGASVGTLNTANLTFAPGSAYSVDINGTTPACDKISSSGVVNCGAATLSVASLAGTPVNGQVFTIVNAAGGVSGTFNGLPNGTVFTQQGCSFQIFYTGTQVNIVPNAAPTVATAAAATPNPATNMTTVLSVLGADDAGEPALTYTWSTTGTPPAAVTFSANGTNAAKSCTATFTMAGSYTLRATIADAGGLSVTSDVVVTVNKVTPVITWATPTAITYGTALSATQLNATASVPGSFNYNPPAGTVLPVGNQTLNVTFTPTDTVNYNNATASVTLTVNPSVCTWTGAVNGSWSNAGNWDRLPVGGEDLVFNGSANASTTNDLAADTSFRSITFNAGAAAFTLAGNRITLTGSITSNSTNVQTISLPMILTAAHSVNAASGAISLSGILSGTGGLIKSGPNALTLSGANTHTGGIIHNAGTLNINSTTALGAASSGLTIAAGTTINNSTGAAITVANANPLTISGSFTFTGTNNLTFGAGAVTLSNSTMTISANTLAIPGVIGGAATLTKAGGGTLSLTNTANTYTGLTTISAGILKVANLANAGSACSLGTNGTIALGSGTSTGTLYYTGTGTVSTNRVINLAGTTGGGMIEEAGASGTVTFTAACTATGAGSKTLTLKGSTSATGVFAGAIVDNSTTNKTLLAKSGTGVWRLSGACTYTGTTAITGGTLQLGNGGLTGALSPSSAIAVTSPGILQFNRTNTVTQGTDFASVIAGTGALIQAGSGTLALNGANTYTGKSSIKAGTISAGSLANVGAGASALGAPTTVANGTIEIGSTTVAGTLLFTAAVTSDRLVNLAGTTGGATITHHSSGTCTLGGVTATGSGIKTLTLNGNAGGAGIISGVIPNSASATAVTKSGTGVWTLGGVNTYTGATTVNGGTLLVNGSTASGSAVAVNNSATLGGSGTANGVITPASGGAVAPGAAVGVSVGTLNTANLTFAPGSAYSVDINGTTPACDKISSSGVVNCGAATLSVASLAGTPVNGQVFTIVNAAGGVSGTFNGLPNGTVFTQQGCSFQIFYTGTQVNIVPNAAPTVATAAAATPNPATGMTTVLSVLGADDAGEPALTYTWSTTGTPPAAVTFSANGTNAAKSCTATFTMAGSYTLRATIADAGGLSVTSDVAVTVNSNSAPVAQNQAPSTNEDTAVAITLVATDADSDPLTYAVVAGPSHGTLTGTAPNLTYTPTANYFGADSFTFKANDGHLDSNVATVSLTVNPINDPPVAQAQSVQVAYNGSVAVTLVATDVENNPLTYAVVANPSHGTLTGTAPNLTYAPTGGYSGPDSFTFKANDGTVDSNVATVSITVNPLPTLSGTIASNQTLSGIYRVTGSVTVNAGVTLTLSAGTILKFSGVYYLDVYGALVAQGTAVNKVYFTSWTDDTVGGDTNGDGTATGPTLAGGDWAYIRARDNSAVQLNYSEVRYAGSSYAAIYGYSCPLTLDIQNCLISNSKTAGIIGNIASTGGTFTVRNTEVKDCTGSGISFLGIYNGAGSITVSNNQVRRCGGIGIEVLNATPRTITGNTIENSSGLGIHVYPDTALGTNTMTANGKSNAVGLTTGTLATNATWQPPTGTKVFLVDGNVTVPVGKSLTVPAGAIVKMCTSTYLDVAGTLTTQGTSGNRVCFTSWRESAISVGGDTGDGIPVSKGDWNFIQCRNDSSISLAYTDVRFGGSYMAAIYGNYTPAKLELRNCVVTQSLSAGIYFYGSTVPTSLTMYGTEVSFCSQSGLLMPYGVANIFAASAGNNFANNARYGVEISSSGRGGLESSNFTGNAMGGAYANAGAALDLRNCYWGHASGPNAGAGTGSGQSVTSTVLYNPWRTAAAPTVPLVRTARFSTEKMSSAGQVKLIGVADEAATWSIEIRDSGSTLVRTLTASGVAATIVWDGKNASNNPVPDGKYTANWTVTSQPTPSRVETLQGILDVSAKAVVRIDTPAENALVKVGDGVTVTGVVQAVSGGDAINGYDLYYGMGSAPTAWYQITSAAAPVSGTLGYFTVPDGSSQISFRLRALVGSTVSAEAKVTVACTSNSVSLALFSPNGDGAYDTTTVQGFAGAVSNWQFAVLNGGGTTVRSEALPQGNLCSYTWDGRDGGGAVLPDGNYTLRLTATELAGSTATLNGATVIDNTPPNLSVVSPANGTVVCQGTSIVGSANDPHFGYWVLEAGQGVSPATYSTLASGTQGVTNGTLVAWNTSSLPTGTWTLRLQSTDSVANSSSTSVQVTIDRINFSNLSFPNEFAPAFGNVGMFSFQVDKAADITATIHHVYWTSLDGYRNYDHSVVESTPVRTMQTTAAAPGTVTMYWNGRTGPADTDPMVQEGCYLVRLSATQPSTVLVGSFDPPYTDNPEVYSQPAENVVVSPLVFDPSTGKGITYSYSLSRSSFVGLQVIAYTSPAYVATPVIAQPRAVGAHVETWDGRYGIGHAQVGQLVPANTYYSFFFNVPTPANSMIVNNAFKVSALIAEQYRIIELYNHVSTLKFSLSHQATVAVTIRDPNNNVFRTLRAHTDGALQPGAQELLWDGRDNSGRIVDTEGLYSVQVEAIEPTTSITSSAQTIIQVYK